MFVREVYVRMTRGCDASSSTPQFEHWAAKIAAARTGEAAGDAEGLSITFSIEPLIINLQAPQCWKNFVNPLDFVSIAEIVAIRDKYGASVDIFALLQ